MSNPLADSRPAVILLAEDNDDDVELTRLSLAQAKMAVDLRCVDNGEECMAFLRKQGRFADAPTPDLLLLDLNMPLMDGREVLVELTRDDALRHIPVVILTTSGHYRDILEMYRLRCSSYITKPVDLEQFQRVIREFTNYWFTVVVLPHGDA